jgi:ferredoxin
VLVTGNYTLTIRRLQQALKGHHAWLLAANSNGINVWCAAGGGHLTHHDIISVVRTSRIEEHVSHRQLVLPQLGATGIERAKIAKATGWESHWGPARLEDLPDYLDRRLQATAEDRFIKFPLWERLEMAWIWLLPLLALGLPAAYLTSGLRGALTAGLTLALMAWGLFALTPWLPLRRSQRWLTFSVLGVLSTVFGTGFLMTLGETELRPLAIHGGIILAAAAILAIDFEGTTPWYGGVINTIGNQAYITLEEMLCTGETDCVQVCPKAVLAMDPDQQLVMIVDSGACVQCGACIVQCPSDALFFRYDDGSIVGPEVIRRTRLNLLARRSIKISD